MGDTSLFIHGMRESRLEQRQRLRWTSAEGFDCGDHKEFKRNHRRNRIPRQAEDRLSAAPSENDRLAWAERNCVEKDFRAEILQHLFDEIVFPSGNSAA